MEFSVKKGHPEKQRTHCIVAGIFENRQLTPVVEQLDALSQGYISNLLRKGDIQGQLGQTLLLQMVPNTLCDRILLVGCGHEQTLGDKEFRDIIRKMMAALNQTSATEAVCFLTELPVKEREVRWKIKQAIEIISEASYVFEAFKSKKEKDKKSLRRMTLTVSNKRDLPLAERALSEGEALGTQIQFAKDLGNTPPNICTPLFLAKEAEQLASKYPTLSCAILEEKEIKALKMGAFLSVAQGSKNSPKLITLEYRGRKDKQKPIVLVGKGITFDTGGNSLKTPTSMIGMKYDMSGAGTVLATLGFAAAMELPLNVVGVIPTAENMPGNAATRPEDIVTSMSGMTIEILNTDAEGRLILCDALTYCERFDPDVVIDIATLTGACVMTFSSHVSALLSNHKPLADALLDAGQKSYDRCWQLPLWEEYQETLNSNFADIANVGNPPEAGTILAACFLSRFTKKYHWAHLDIAGVASRSSKGERSATGRPISLLAQYLMDRCQHSH